MSDARNRRRSSEQVAVLRISAHEDLLVAARRCVREKLLVSENVVRLDMERIRVVDEEEAGEYPGLTSVIRKHMVECIVVDPAPSSLNWDWQPLDQVPTLQKHR